MLPVTKILAPTDFSSASLKAHEAALELARFFDCQLLVAHIVEPVPALPAEPDYGLGPPAYVPELQDDLHQRLKEWVHECGLDAVSCATAVRHGDPAREIVRLSSEESADLIVIATHGLTGWRHLVFGSVAEQVVRTAACPVLTLRVGE